MMRRTPMKRGTKPLARRKPMSQGTSPIKRRRPRKRPDRAFADACFGQPCYLLVPGVECAARNTVVPCHSNSQADGKGMGIKAKDERTVPGCMHCHYEIDQGKRLTKEERRDVWLRAYARWQPVRDVIMEVVSDDRALPLP